jgi:hypothetical protein
MPVPNTETHSLGYASQVLVNAVIGNLKYWDWTCPVTRTYRELAH